MGSCLTNRVASSFYHSYSSVTIRVQCQLLIILCFIVTPKHMEIDVFFVREKVLTMKLFIYHIPALDQWADVLTKPLSSAHFEFLRGKLNVKTLPLEFEEGY